MNKTFMFCDDLELQRVNIMFLNRGNVNCVNPYIHSIIIINIQNY